MTKEAIITSYNTKKHKLVIYVNGLWSNELKKRHRPAVLKKIKISLNNYYNQQLKILDDERDRLILALSPSTPSKKACLVGINDYNGSAPDLKGCVNDVYILRDLLVSQYKYKMEDIKVITNENATRKNILKEFTSLVQQAKSGDSICFTFSGHGSYMKDRNHDEADGRDELIISFDYCAITDDEIKTILDTYLNTGVDMFTLFDSCNSGTISDLKYSFNNNTLTTINESYKETKGNVIALSGCKDDQFAADVLVDNNAFNGALSSAFVVTLRNNPTITWNELLTKIREIIVYNKFDQVPQITIGKSRDMSGLKVNI